MNDSTGLVLCGGGGKGAFQIGAWKALYENGIMEEITSIAGTSVGALNAALFAIGDIDLAERIWEDINPQDLLSPDITSQRCLFSRNGMLEIFEKVPFKKLHSSKIKVYVTLWNKSKQCAEYRLINDLDVNMIEAILLASSAMPVAYPAVTIDGQEYMDAGGNEFYNTPIESLYLNGTRNIYIITLDQGFMLHNIRNKDERVDACDRFPGCEMTVIRPMEHLGALFRGTLNFSSENVLKLINSGYIDADRQLKGDYSIMMNNYVDVNIKLEKMIMENFHSAEDLQHFVSLSGMCGNHPTMGGKIHWKNVVVLDGWKLQQHATMGRGWNHYRILNEKDRCVLFTFDVSKLVNALDRYIRNMKK